ncbi:Glutamate receptor ionotropic, NMDA 3A, partial [Frankliniella fusca]
MRDDEELVPNCVILHPAPQELRLAAMQALAGRADWLEERPARALASSFQILNLVRQPSPAGRAPVLQQATHQTDDVVDALDEEGERVRGMWRGVGRILGRVVDLDTIVWPGGDLVVPGLSVRARSVFRIVTALAPPFVMEAELDEDGQCLRGLPCHRLLTRGKDNLTLVFSELETQERLEEEAEANAEDVVDVVVDYPQDAAGLASTEATESATHTGQGGRQDSWAAPGSPAATADAGGGGGGGGGRGDHDVRYFVERRDSEEQFDLPKYK